jgi:hypothetical protein
MFSDAGYAMVGVIVSSLIGATATVRSPTSPSAPAAEAARADADRDEHTDDPPRKSP